uniref:Calmodulin-lysine N-methyltransferase n=1 Tax=Aureoumbra lagunensis TaxID=44058 RepID=A0A7S3JS38_9STRA|mmetsp:Transcript_12125/g.16394  ORF Transcript_12125/g.16394 Transcript_12125/m.16394 type:complete len:549 (+) Transcript_12125:299-1945(+)
MEENGEKDGQRSIENVNRPCMVSILRNGAINNKMKQREVLRNLSWRQLYCGKNEYIIELNDSRALKFIQHQQSELQGIGTGGTVWPAAHVLAKFLERYYLCPETNTSSMKDLSVLDLGAGTGVAGLVASALGAHVILCDIPQVLFLAETNFLKNKDFIQGSIQICPFDWGQLSTTTTIVQKQAYDLILVSECVLPQLYPLEPLCDAIAFFLLTWKEKKTKALIAYEHRPYPKFDPITKFSQLLNERNLSISKVCATQLDPLYQADDIHLFWIFPQSDHTFLGKEDTDTDHRALICLDWNGHEEKQIARFQMDQTKFFQLELSQQDEIGCALWPSALVTAHYLLAVDPSQKKSKTWHVLELGAGAGLVSACLALRGHKITSTDVPYSSALKLLKANLSHFDNVNILPYAWGAHHHDHEDYNYIHSTQFDLIICSDCLYNSSAVTPLLHSFIHLLAPSIHNKKCPALLLVNEQRTALDSFLRAFRLDPSFTHLDLIKLHLPPSFALIDCLPPHRQPSPIAAFYIQPKGIKTEGQQPRTPSVAAPLSHWIH